MLAGVALQIGWLPVGLAAQERAISSMRELCSMREPLQVWGRKVGDAGITPE